MQHPRMMGFIRDVDDVVRAIERAKEEGVRVNILIGAGCSESAGIPTASGILEIVMQKYPREYARANSDDYALHVWQC